MATLNKIYLTLIVLLPFVITSMHFWLSDAESPPIVLEEIYYIPLFSGYPPLRSQRCALELRDCLAGICAFLLRDLDNLFARFPGSLPAFALFRIFAFLVGSRIHCEKTTAKTVGKRSLPCRHWTDGNDDRFRYLKIPPLCTILAFSQRIQEGKGNVDKAVHAIWDSARNMQKIVESTLDFARPIQLDIKEEELKGIIEKVVQTCKTKAEESGVNLSVQVPTGSM